MALQKPYNDDYGASHSAAYHKVIETNINWKDSTGRIAVAVYVDSAAKAAGKQPVAVKSFPVPYTITPADEQNPAVVASFEDVFGLTALEQTGVNPVKKAYQWLKSLVDYSDASDV